MKISSIKAGAERFIANIECKNEQRFLDDYIRVHDDFMSGDTARELDKCRKTVANYLSNKGVSVDIFDAGHEAGELIGSKAEKMCENKIAIKAQDILTGKSQTRLMNADTNATFSHVEKDFMVVDDEKEGIQRVRVLKHETEDNFLRALYRNISEMVNCIQKTNK